MSRASGAIAKSYCSRKSEAGLRLAQMVVSSVDVEVGGGAELR
jgi:hypothetical protein